jgi:hypothetical protein
MLRGRLRRFGRIVFLVVAAVAFAWLEVWSFREGWRLERSEPRIKLGAGPFVGSWDWRWSLRLVPAITIAVFGVWLLPVIARRARARISVVVTALVAAVFAWALAASDGWTAVIKPVVDPTEYWDGARRAPPWPTYLRTYLARQASYSVHVRGHPPGFSVLLIAMRRVGLASPWAAAAVSYIGIAMAVVAVAYCVHRLAGRAAMIRSLPFLALAPYAVWQGTSADAFFAGFAACGIALLVVAMTSPQRRVRRGAALGGGVVLGAMCFLTFGAPTLVPLVLALTLLGRKVRWIPITLVGVAVVVGAFAAMHFWWLDGLTATRRFYKIGTAQYRPGSYFVWANLAVLAIALGPAVLAGLTRLNRSRLAVIAIGGLLCVFAADVSGLSKGETERIWLLYMPWIAVAAGLLGGSTQRTRWWLGAQAATAVLLQAALISKW